MALNNLRVVYNNLVDLSTTATLTASSAQAATPASNLPKPLFISLFPENNSTAAQLEMERSHQIYGKLMTVPGLTYSNLDIYNTRFDLEEV